MLTLTHFGEIGFSTCVYEKCLGPITYLYSVIYVISLVPGILKNKIHTVLCSFCLFSFVVEFEGIYFGDLILGLISFSRFLFFWTLITVLTFWSFSSCRWMYLFLPFFMLFLVRFLSRLFMNVNAYGPPTRPFEPPKALWILCDDQMTAESFFQSFNLCSPSTCLSTTMSCAPNNHSFCVWGDLRP